MKFSIFAFIAGIALITLLAFKPSDQVRKDYAQVNQIEGLYVFADSKPMAEYEYLGTVKASFTMGSTQYQSLRDKLIKKCKNDYPNADGIILNFHDGGTDHADAIKFK